MVDAGVEELGLFFIGESFMCDWLPEAIAFAKHRGIRYAFLTTNGSLATPERVRACMEAGLDSLKFSMNNADEAPVPQHRESEGRSSSTMRSRTSRLRARSVTSGGFTCGLYASSIRYDGAQQERMQALVDEILPFVDEHYWLPLYSMGSLAKEREGELGYRPDRRQPGPHRRAARAAAVLVGLHRGPHHARRQALGVLLRRGRPLGHGGPERSRRLPTAGTARDSASCAKRT